jgi:transcriptional regulator with XRE-family HTH domain
MNSSERPYCCETAPVCASATLGTRIREIRLLRELTVAELAAKAEISRSELAKIESNADLPPLRVLKRLAVELGTSVRYLSKGRVGAVSQVEHGVVVPEALVALALESHWSFATVKALTDARETLASTVAGRAKGVFSRNDWQELAGCLAPFMDSELG